VGFGVGGRRYKNPEKATTLMERRTYFTAEIVIVAASLFSAA
jgi:hypothetical protein